MCMLASVTGDRIKSLWFASGGEVDYNSPGVSLGISLQSLPDRELLSPNLVSGQKAKWKMQNGKETGATRKLLGDGWATHFVIGQASRTPVLGDLNYNLTQS